MELRNVNNEKKLDAAGLSGLQPDYTFEKEVERKRKLNRRYGKK
jgi:hypothetical protein